MQLNTERNIKANIVVRTASYVTFSVSSKIATVLDASLCSFFGSSRHHISLATYLKLALKNTFCLLGYGGLSI